MTNSALLDKNIVIDIITARERIEVVLEILKKELD
jgi:hypothetical protein